MPPRQTDPERRGRGLQGTGHERCGDESILGGFDRIQPLAAGSTGKSQLLGRADLSGLLEHALRGFEVGLRDVIQYVRPTRAHQTHCHLLDG